MEERLLYNLPTAAERLGGISVVTLRRYIAAGAIPVVRIGRRVFVRPEALEKLIKRIERPAREAAAR